jgi:hypothetical protein
MKIKGRRVRSKFTDEEKRKFYEQIAGSSRVYKNRKKYTRSDIKMNRRLSNDNQED